MLVAMPIAYTIDTARGIINEVWSDDVTADDLARHWQTMLADPAARRIARNIGDLRMATLRFTGRELADTFKTVAQPILAGLPWKTAILVGAPDQYGTARQFEVIAEFVVTDCIFQDYDAALAWLLAD